MTARLLVLSAILACGSVATRQTRAERVPPRQAFAQFPAQIGRWHGQGALAIDSRSLGVLGVDDYVSRVYGSGNAELGLYVGYYESQRQGDAVHSPLNCLPGAGWQPLSHRYIDVPVGGGASIPLNRYVIQKGLDRQVVLYWYQSHGRVIPNEYAGKLYMIYDAIRLNRTDAAIVRVVSPAVNASAEAEEAAHASAVDFVTAMFPVLTRYLPS